MTTALTHPRRALRRDNEYRFKGFRRNGFRVNYVSFRGHPDDDGGLEGVSVTWLGRRRGEAQRSFHVCKSAEEFWALAIFANACDPEHA